MDTARHIYLAPYFGYEQTMPGHPWQIQGVEGGDVFTEEGPFETRAEALAAVPGYAETLGWPKDSYILSIDE